MAEAFSIKFELAPDRSADLEILSAAAIAWVEALRAAAQAVDANTDVRVRLIDVERRSALYNVMGEWFDRAADLERLEDRPHFFDFGDAALVDRGSAVDSSDTA